MQEWKRPLRKSKILSLLKFMHFGRALDFQSCVCFLLTRVHGGYLWLDQPYLIDQAIIHMISGLPTYGEDLTDSLREKHAPQEEVYSKYDTCRRKRGVVILEINDSIVRFATQILTCKLICKLWKE
jgi:hypothetical protein